MYIGKHIYIENIYVYIKKKMYENVWLVFIFYYKNIKTNDQKIILR